MKTVDINMSPFNTTTKNSFKKLFKRLGWETKVIGDIFVITYPINDEDLLDFFIDSMI